MHGLGIPTTRALGIVGSDLPVRRETIETAATLLRLSPSHVRFGTFEYFAARGEALRVRELADYVIGRHFPEAAGTGSPYVALLGEVVHRTARLVAQWMAVGFCHGVLNTDNMSVLGLTLDYGPFGFLDEFDAGHICNHSDTEGRYTGMASSPRQARPSRWCSAFTTRCCARSRSPMCASGSPAPRSSPCRSRRASSKS
jgi:uncharacterized protein YdiU (UPF0061 family)